MATAQASRSNGAADPVVARFSALSLADVVRARDAYHVHLLHLPNVFAVYDWNVGHQVYWGEVGHYTIGAKACELVRPPALRAYLEANQTNISFDLDDIANGHYLTPTGTIFYPLADVPDRVWKQRKAGVGRPHEGPNHFADMDDPVEEGGATLLSLFEHNPASLTPEAWVAFYKAKDITPSHMGLLPFRVGQLYQVMLDELANGATDRALCAAGVMAHYVGDACQPLHVSRFHDGRPDTDEAGVHSAYETTMVTRRRKEIISGLESALRSVKPRAEVTGRAAVEHAVAKLMQRSIDALPPEHICDVWTDSGHDSVVMWTELGQATIDRMADGCRTLAMIWSSAWAEAGTAAPAANAADRDALKAIYSDTTFAPSQYLPAFVGVPAHA